MEAKAVILTEYKGLTVSEISGLRLKIKEAGGEFKVVKNTLARIAAKQTPVESAIDFFNGPTAIVFGYGDPIAIAKKLLDFTSENEKLKIKTGVIEGKVYTVEEIKALSTLPSRTALYSMLLGALQYPMRGFALTLRSTITQLYYALESLKNKKEESGGN